MLVAYVVISLRSVSGDRAGQVLPNSTWHWWGTCNTNATQHRRHVVGATALLAVPMAEVKEVLGMLVF
jgi:hypothetical protein